MTDQPLLKKNRAETHAMISVKREDAQRLAALKYQIGANEKRIIYTPEVFALAVDALAERFKEAKDAEDAT